MAFYSSQLIMGSGSPLGTVNEYSGESLKKIKQ
jgi:hypothetical protein